MAGEVMERMVEVLAETMAAGSLAIVVGVEVMEAATVMGVWGAMEAEIVGEAAVAASAAVQEVAVTRAVTAAVTMAAVQTVAAAAVMVDVVVMMAMVADMNLARSHPVPQGQYKSVSDQGNRSFRSQPRWGAAQAVMEGNRSAQSARSHRSGRAAPVLQHCSLCSRRGRHCSHCIAGRKSTFRPGCSCKPQMQSPRQFDTQATVRVGENLVTLVGLMVKRGVTVALEQMEGGMVEVVPMGVSASLEDMAVELVGMVEDLVQLPTCHHQNPHTRSRSCQSLRQSFHQNLRQPLVRKAALWEDLRAACQVREVDLGE